MSRVFVILMILTICAFSSSAFAQEESVQDEQIERIVPREIDPNTIKSLVYTYWESTALKEAIDARSMVAEQKRKEQEAEEERRKRESEELKQEVTEQEVSTMSTDSLEVIDPGIREFGLGGIVYTSKDDWTIWFNGQRITSKSVLPEEVKNLMVHKEFIELDWFDKYTNRIFPVRLRPHQRFNIDTQIFLPGDKG